MPKVKDTGLTPRQLLFVDEYVKDFNGSRAAIAAGYSKKTAKESACQVLTSINVKKYILKEFEKLGGATQMALRETFKLAASDIADYCEIEPGGGLRQKPFEEMPEGATSCIKELKVKRNITESADGKRTFTTDMVEYKLHDKCKSIDNILKIAQLITDKIDITSGGEKIEPIKFVIVKKDKKK